MKIGILTYHDGINHGAFLQVYCMYKFCQSLGHEVEIINYKNFKHWLLEYRHFLIKKNPRKIVSNVRKILKFKKNHKLLPLSPFTFHHNKIKQDCYDLIIIGSDEVWNFRNELVGFDPIYYGAIFNIPQVAYAPSFGSVDPKIAIPKEIIESVEKIKAISTRDHNSATIINSITNYNPPQVVDPVFLFDLQKYVTNCPHDNFILVYAHQVDEKRVSELKKVAQEQNKKIISVAYPHKWCDYNIVALDAFDWLGYFWKADFVLTSMFHGTMISIKFNKEFCLMMTSYRKNKFSILSDLELNDRILRSADSVASKFDKKINYSRVNKHIKNQINISRNFLSDNISTHAKTY